MAQVRLCHSRMPFVRAYLREAQEMVFDAHEKAFQFFKGVPTRGIYDNMKTAVVLEARVFDTMRSTSARTASSTGALSS